MIERSPDHWWVTTKSFASLQKCRIERSPDHWWVTTSPSGREPLQMNWKVTRSLVSYDIHQYLRIVWNRLKGHQIIGELRRNWASCSIHAVLLKGHQIIGELRPAYLTITSYFGDWKVTRSLVSYDGVGKVVVVVVVLKGHQIIGELRQIKRGPKSP